MNHYSLKDYIKLFLYKLTTNMTLKSQTELTPPLQKQRKGILINFFEMLI